MVSNESFKIGKIPKLNPFSQDYKNFWKSEKRKCIEGYWVGGKFMPPVTYYYVNHHIIELNKTEHSKVKTLANPFLRDLEWEKGRLLLEARGFSGFSDDPLHTCRHDYKDAELYWDFKEEKIVSIEEINLSENGRRYQKIQYINPRDYLQKIHPKNLGKPLYENEARNIIDIEARGGGKSFFAAAAIAHNFLFDGATDYDELLALLKEGEKSASETLIGAIDTKYSKNLIQKVKLSLEHMKGGIKFNGIYYPPPFLKAYSGSWESGKTIIAEYDEKVGGEWVTKGSRSKIHHRSFGDNPFAANGTRPGLTLLEEIGFFNNLTQSLGQIKECTNNGAYKFGTVWMFGTGGDMSGGATEEAKKVFYDPEAYDCLSFNDEWENKGKIGYFVPATKGLNQFKDEEGNTNVEAALDYLMKRREKAASASDRKPLDDELQQRPLIPSEAFLVLTGNVFPVADLKDHLNELESHKKLKSIGNKGTLGRDENGKVFWKGNDSLIPCDYPVREKDDKEGCIVIWEHPEKSFTPGLYIAGIDPYSQDDAPNSESLGSCIIYKRFLTNDKTYHWPVAEYTARPDTTDTFNENCRRLLEYYNALALYENQVKGLKQYFQTKYCLHLLATQPGIIQEISPNSKVSRGYGIHMSKPIKQYAEIKLRDWLNEEYEEGKKNLTKIYSIPLLKELIAYNVDGNFDRVISMMLCIIQDLEMFKIVSTENEEIEIDSFFDKRLFI